jgi:hypothetical protein
MAELVPTGPPLPDTEDVYRAILYPMHWNSERNIPSSAAFSDQVFSVDVASRTTPALTRARFKIVLQLAIFNVGVAREIGYDSRDELDPNVPDNQAHAHVYFMDFDNLSSKKRKTIARQLSEKCRVIA